MNLQQARISIKKLVETKAIERLNTGVKNKPAVYIINKKGKDLLSQYNRIWYNHVIPNISA